MSEVFIKEDAGLNLNRANKLLAGIGNSSAVFKAVHAALRRAAQSAKAKAGTFASSRYYISAGGFKGHVKDKITMEGGASAGGVTGVRLTFAGSVIRLIEFNTRFSKDGGVAVSVKKGSGGVIANGFIANTGRLGVYERVGPSRLPIEQSAAHMMMDEQVTGKMEKQIVETFNTRIDHEIDRILNGW